MVIDEYTRDYNFELNLFLANTGFHVDFDVIICRFLCGFYADSLRT